MKVFIHSSVGGLLRNPVVGVAISLTHATLCSPSTSFGRYGLHHYNVSAPFRSFTTISPKKVKKNVIMSVLDIGGTKISKDDVVKDEPTNNVPDTIFSKLGLQLHKRDQHPLGILKNAIYDYFDKNYSTEFVKFDDLCPIVSVKQNFDDVLVPADHVSRNYNDTYYIDAQTVLRCHTSAHQAELLRMGQTHFLVTGDVYRRDSIDSTHYPVFHQMEGFRVFTPEEWEKSPIDSTSYAAAELKNTLEGLARHLFGDVEMRWVDAYFPFTSPSYELEIYFKPNMKTHWVGKEVKKINPVCKSYARFSSWIPSLKPNPNLGCFNSKPFYSCFLQVISEAIDASVRDEDGNVGMVVLRNEFEERDESVIRVRNSS
ncbi:phenylalanine--tRNA ligase [Ranunculus cassubicifolius]